MFKDLDLTKRLPSPKLFLARPSKEVTMRLADVFDVQLSLSDSDLHALDFSIFSWTESTLSHRKNGKVDLSETTANQELVLNPLREQLLEKMLIKMSLNNEVEWFIIDSFEETVSQDKEVVTYKCLHLPHEMTHTDIGRGDYEEELIELQEIVALLLEDTLWQIGEVDNTVPELYRQLSFSSQTSILDCLNQVSQTYNIYFEYDTNNRLINLRNHETRNTYRGLNIDYGRLLDEYIIGSTSEEIVTQLVVTGNEDMGIQNVNPTGLPYLEDYSYFLYPFEYDEVNNKVLKHSIFMTDALAIALHKYKKLQSLYENEIIVINEQLAQLSVDIGTYESEADMLQMEYDNTLDRLDTAKAAEASAEILDPIIREREEKRVALAQKKAQIDEAKSQLEFKEKRLETIHNAVEVDSGFTEETKKELKQFRIRRYWSNEDYVDELELYEAGLEQFSKQREPKKAINVTMTNIYNVIEEDYYWDKICVGDIAKVSDRRRNFMYKAPIMTAEINFDEDNVSITIADDKSLLTENGELLQILDQASNTNNVVQHNYKKWSNVDDLSDAISQLISGEWDANKNQITAGVNNDITMGKRGLIITNPDFPKDMIIAQSGIIALSDDGGETWKTAIRPDGIIANRLIGNILIGHELVLGAENNTFHFDETGAYFDVNYLKISSSQGSENLVEAWEYAREVIKSMADDDRISPYEKKELRTQWARMVERYMAIKQRAETYFEDYESVPEYTNLIAQHEKLFKYFFERLHGEDTTPMLDPTNVGTTINIDRDEFTGLFADYDRMYSALEDELDNNFREALQENQKALDDIMQSIEELTDTLDYVCRLTSTNGTVFKNNNINTTLIAELRRGTEDLTPVVPPSGFVWQKFDKDGVEDVAWGQAQVAIGNVVQITRDDVHEKATFRVSFYYDKIKTLAKKVDLNG